MPNGAYLLRLEHSSHLEHDRSGGLDLVAREKRPFGKHQVNACSLYAFDAADGAGEFALERAQMVDVLDEGGCAKRIGLVENLITDAAAFRQAGFGELHAQPGDPVLRHHDDLAVVLDLVGNRL